MDRAQLIENAFFSDLRCCSLKLSSLHQLLEHLEDDHVHIVDSQGQIVHSAMDEGLAPTHSFLPITFDSPPLVHASKLHVKPFPSLVFNHLEHETNTCAYESAGFDDSSPISSPASTDLYYFSDSSDDAPLFPSDYFSDDSFSTRLPWDDDSSTFPKTSNVPTGPLSVPPIVTSVHADPPLVHSPKPFRPFEQFTPFAETLHVGDDQQPPAKRRKLRKPSYDADGDSRSESPDGIRIGEKRTTGKSQMNAYRGRRASCKTDFTRTNSDNKKRIQCPTLGCIKTYQTPGGLQYHITKGHCIIDETIRYIKTEPIETNTQPHDLLRAGNTPR